MTAVRDGRVFPRVGAGAQVWLSNHQLNGISVSFYPICPFKSHSPILDTDTHTCPSVHLKMCALMQEVHRGIPWELILNVERWRRKDEMMDKMCPAVCFKNKHLFHCPSYLEVTVNFSVQLLVSPSLHTHFYIHTPGTPLLHSQYYWSLMASKEEVGRQEGRTHFKEWWSGHSGKKAVEGWGGASRDISHHSFTLLAE